MLNRDEILSHSDLRKETVPVPEWGGDVVVIEMSGEARDAWEVSLTKRGPGYNIVNARAKLVAATVSDENGKLLFQDSEDVEKIGRLSSVALDRICAVAQRINGLTRAELKEAEGNSAADPSGNSISN